jgi:hypothetical protein
MTPDPVRQHQRGILQRVFQTLILPSQHDDLGLGVTAYLALRSFMSAIAAETASSIVRSSNPTPRT